MDGMWMAWLRTWDTLSHDVSVITCARYMRKSDVWGVLSTHSVGYSRLLSAVNETYCNKLFKKKKNWIVLSWAPPAFGRVPFPPGIARGRVPSPILLRRNGLCDFFAWFTMELVFEWDCSLKVWSKSHRRVFARFIQCEIPLSLISLGFLFG